MKFNFTRFFMMLFYAVTGMGVILMFYSAEIGGVMGTKGSHVVIISHVFTFISLSMLPFIQAGGMPSAPESLADVLTLNVGFIVGGLLYFGGAIFRDFGIDFGSIYMTTTMVLFLACALLSFFRNRFGRYF